MCGIAGILHRHSEDRVSEQDLQQITDPIAHRGPDGHGYWTHENIGFGHRRLSIIDLEGSLQPMKGVDEKYVITFNGEIYNFQELKSELLKLGYKFKTKGDTEIILTAYKHWNVGCLEKFRGMFAFAIADLEKQEVFLARDHYGIKPLLYYQGANSFVFGSEMQQFHQHKYFHKEVDASGIQDYFNFGYIPAPKTIFKNLKKLEPGHYLKVDFQGKILQHKEYYDITFQVDTSKKYEEWIEIVGKAIDDSVAYHKISDVSYGTFLSGGIDSSLIASSLSKYGTNVDAFTMGFHNEEFNEVPYAKQVAEQYKLNHHIEYIDMNDMMEIFPKLLQHYGEPFSDSSAIPTYYISKKIREYITVVLSGDGGDEAFGGYFSYQNFLKIAHPNAPKDAHKTFVKNVLKQFGKYYPTTPRKPQLNDWLNIVSVDPKSLYQPLFSEDFKKENFRSSEIFSNWYAKAKDRGLDLFQTASYLDYKTYIHSDILTKVDIASMMNSLEVRTPLIDKEIIGLATQMPTQFKINQNANGSWTKKKVLNSIAEQRFGTEFTQRKKRGFTVPLNDWFGTTQELGNDFENIINSKQSRLYEFLEYKSTVEAYKKDHVFSPNMKYQLYFLEQWLQSN